MKASLRWGPSSTVGPMSSSLLWWSSGEGGVLPCLVGEAWGRRGNRDHQLHGQPARSESGRVGHRRRAHLPNRRDQELASGTSLQVFSLLLGKYLVRSWFSGLRCLPTTRKDHHHPPVSRLHPDANYSTIQLGNWSINNPLGPSEGRKPLHSSGSPDRCQHCWLWRAVCYAALVQGKY